ncbi:MAG: bifunctional phosphopantothenoylcysteine decarboxylase/phosphopantothenate--cysteine ligase CoaBC [Salibacteraceae bacterium]
MLRGKKILLGVTGSIAAYKAALLVRLLVKAGAEVQVVMTPAAKEFITPLTLGTLSRRPVVSAYTADPNSGVWNNHVELGLWGDVLLMAPVTSNTLAKMANGLCDNVLMATYQSARCPVWVAPAMDLDMFQHPATQANLSQLRQYGHHIVEPESGELASGLEGKGRMAEPEHLVADLQDYFAENRPLAGKKVLITAGPTHEAIDPVRFIGNRSSGKMGVALADEAARRGAEVTLILGPSKEQPQENMQVLRIQSAAEMHTACLEAFPKTDIGILSAAVADFRPAQVARQKIKKAAGEVPEILLERTVDIAKALGETKQPHQLLVGFALETHDEESNARKKIISKNLDLIVLNSLNDAGAGFGHETNRITLIDRQNNSKRFELKTKHEVAADILDALQTLNHA